MHLKLYSFDSNIINQIYPKHDILQQVDLWKRKGAGYIEIYNYVDDLTFKFALAVECFTKLLSEIHETQYFLNLLKSFSTDRTQFKQIEFYPKQ